MFTYLLAAFDMLTLNYFAWNTVRQAFFALHVLTIFTSLTKGHMGELNASLVTALSQAQMPSRYRFLTYFTQEYHLLLRMARLANESLVSSLLFTSFLSNMSLNVIIIGSLLFRDSLQPSEQLVMLAVVAIQTFLALTSVLGLTSWSSSFGTSDRLLFRAQILFLTSMKAESTKNDHDHPQQSALTLAKLKLAALYEQVLSSDEFRFTLGPFVKISHASVYKYALLYSGMVMYVAKMVRKGKL